MSRYAPSCQISSLLANDHRGNRVHGVLGDVLGSLQILRCNPFGGYGFDPVPPKLEEQP